MCVCVLLLLLLFVLFWFVCLFVCLLFFFFGWYPATIYLSSCLSVYTPPRTLRSSSENKTKKKQKTKHFPVQDGNVRALVSGRSLFSVLLFVLV